MHIDVDYFKTMYAYETDEEDTEEHILQRVVKLEARLSRRNLQIREALAIAAIERADDYLARCVSSGSSTMDSVLTLFIWVRGAAPVPG